MNEKIPENSELSVEDALAEVGALKQEVSMMGANAEEIPEYIKIEEALRVGTIEPHVAVQMARALQARKSDYGSRGGH